MKKLPLLVLLAMLLAQPGFVSAHEGEDHSKMSGMSDMPKDSMDGMNMDAGMKEMHAEHVATLTEAATALKTSHPDLAMRLEKMAKHMDMMAKHHEDMKS